MKIKRVKWLPLWMLSILLVWQSWGLAAENFQFVDANGATGYYVDTASISFATVTLDDNANADNPENTENTTTYEVVNARVAVIKAKQNRRYIYLMQFNPQLATYQILASKVQAYDTKQLLESSKEVGTALPYSVTSPMHNIVAFIYEQPRSN